MIYYKCNVCNNILGSAEEKDLNISCCNEHMYKLVPNTVDASKEKHLPVVNVKGNIVEVVVGSDLHPMMAEHHISWVAIETREGRQRKNLVLDAEPKVTFALVEGDEIVSACADCNLHGLWRLNI